MKKYIIRIILLKISLLLPLYPSPFIDNGDGTVFDQASGLIWQKCSIGQNTLTCSGIASNFIWNNAILQCNNLSLVNRSWRLPNINELKSIIDYSKTSGAAINITIFPSTQPSYYWSSTKFSQDTKFVYYVRFSNGSVNSSTKPSSYYVRCVSGP